MLCPAGRALPKLVSLSAAMTAAVQYGVFMWEGAGHATQVWQFYIRSAGGAVSQTALPSSQLQVGELEKYFSGWAICTVLLGNMVVVSIASLYQVLLWDKCTAEGFFFPRKLINTRSITQTVAVWLHDIHPGS